MKFIKQNVVYLALVTAIVAMLGSLYFSNVLGFPPCLLCWYQRICLYPIVVITAVGILRKDVLLHWYVLPLSLIGTGIGIYHNLLYYSIIPESLAPCAAGISCTTKFVEYFGFLTIPLLSLIAFIVIDICMIIYWRANNEQRS